MIGQKGNYITWGKPTTKGPIELETFSLLNVEKIRLLIDNKQVEIANPPLKGRVIELEFGFYEVPKLVKIPFTEIPLAAEWGKFLQGVLENLHSVNE